jgi:hypothetical protein
MITKKSWAKLSPRSRQMHAQVIKLLSNIADEHSLLDWKIGKEARQLLSICKKVSERYLSTGKIN